ncbi:transferase family protein [Fusarium bulbicola]|nr:transferase family protein [Fusarium bulbicola]
MGPKGVVPNVDLIESLADNANIAIWSMVPSLVDELGETPDILIKLKPSKFICASGGPVSPILGSKVDDVVRVLNLTGTTEGLFIGNLWAFKGRNDDIVVLSNGYKISPLETEALVSTHPDIKGGLIIGTGKRQAGLLIKLQDSTSRTNEVLDSVWAAIERANALSLHKSQLQRDYVAFAEFDKPFIRTDKGTIKRRATLEAYSDFIERFYSSRPLY